MKDILEAIHETIPNSKILMSEQTCADLFRQFYEQVRHGDDAHQKWLKDETEKFIKDYLPNAR